ncbi:MAG: hypothetical protein LBI18_11500, partial [Planctomycetaceae bacterium]|nr:hypothetical protein [Planctomycetaceae bacterium]
MKDSISLDKSFWSMHITMATNNLLAVVQYLNRKYANDLVTETTNEEIDETTDHGFEDGGINKIKRLPIFARFGIEDKNTDSSHNKTGVAAENQKSDNHTDIVLQSKISDDLIRYFPFLREIRTYYEAPHQKKDKTNIPASQLSPHNIVRYFLDYAELLNKKRNEYVHARHDKKPLSENDRKRLYGLNRLIEFHRRTIKERFYKTVNNQTADKLLLPLTPKIVVSRTAKDNPEYLCSHGFFNENETDLSPVGLAFFVAQFLEPKYISELVQGLFPKKPKEIQQLFIRAFSVTHIVLPRTRLISDSEFSPQTIGMDILSEIHKCPEELFDMLSPTRQEEFRFIDEETQTDNLMKRFGQNRTETLMLRYLDV